MEEPLIAQTNGVLGRWTFIPLGYRPGVATGTFVPICSIGYPISMALLMRMFGPAAGMSVVPLAAAGLVFLTGWIGRRAGGTLVGLSSSVLLATSPIFLFQSAQPMSDVPAAFLWLLSTALVLTRRRWAGAAVVPVVALAVMTRPNLAPLGLPLLALGLAAKKSDTGQYDWKMGGALCAGLASGAALVAYTNAVLFGAPQSSGYGATGSLYRLQFFWTNVQRYSGWLVETETYVLVLAAGGILRLAKGTSFQRLWAWYSLAVVAIVCLSYLFYTPFGDWTYLRFLLPALPLAFIALTCLSKRGRVGFSLDAREEPTRPLFQMVVLAGLCAPLLAAHVLFIASHGALGARASERRYVDVADYIAGALPDNALFIAAQHSGSVRYYTGRKTMRFDWLPPRELDNAIRQMNSLGYKPYILLEDWEEQWFKSRFRRSALGRLDWPPAAEFRTGTRVRIYDPAKR